jgi:hypothetical protein
VRGKVVAMASGKVMDPETLNANVKKTVYAVRGELYLRASELQKEGKKVHINFTPKNFTPKMIIGAPSSKH